MSWYDAPGDIVPQGEPATPGAARGLVYDAIKVSPAAANNKCTARFDPTDQYEWLIGHGVVQLTVASGSALALYTGEEQVDNLLDQTTAGDLDIGDWSTPLVVPAGSYLRAVWTPALADAVGIIRIQYRIQTPGA